MDAVIFDMDGVLVDTEAAHETLGEEFFKSKRLDMPPEVTRTLIGATGEKFWGTFEARNPGVDSGAVRREYNEFMDSRLTDYSKIMNPGVSSLIASIKRAGYGLALATSSGRANAERVLSQCGLEEFFDVVVCGGDVSESKPSPQIFLKAADLLGVTPSACVIVEDSHNGVRAGKASGATVLGKEDKRFFQDISSADQIVTTLEGLSVHDLEALWDQAN
ncbi:HAD family phosphatase [Actinomycetaceae bacterium MB13-C1-2]|nr:HAD family phosphatase [Actinomycetaceae bacterium MB13-C1-2]